MDKKIIKTGAAPEVIGPYSQAIEAGGFIFCSAQIPMDPQTGELITSDIAAATEQVIANLSAVLSAAGAGLEDVVKATVFLKDMNDFAAMNEIYARHFNKLPPARACIEAARLPKDALIEIEAIAVKR